MKKRGVLLVLACCLTLGLCACGAEEPEQVSASAPEESYTKITSADGVDFYVDDSVVQVSDDVQADAKKITDAVESYALGVLYRGYEGNIGVVDSDKIAVLGLAAELDARTAYIAEAFSDEDFSEAAPYLRYEQFEMTDDAAKVIVTFEMKNPETDEVIADNHEGYVFKKEANDWLLVNNIVDTGHGGDEALAALADDDDAAAWTTTFSYETMKRSDYEAAHDFTYFLGEDGKTADPAKVAAEE
ncbi:MAG: hypothetical protein UDB11_11480 [Peptococcaceae bacterium]|nr:hypothetical protein [Peptococcaceae bacterium]